MSLSTYFRVYFGSLFFIICVTSCIKEGSNSSIPLMKMQDLKASSAFDWKTARVVNFSISNLTPGVVRISSADGSKLFYKAYTGISSSFQVALSLPTTEKEVQINDVGTDDDSFTPTKMLTSYNDNYNSKFIEEKNNNQVIELTPKKKGKSLIKVRLTIDKLKKQVSSFVMYDKSGNTFTYTVNKFISDTPLADKEFVFSKAEHPGIEVVDMR